MVLDNRRRQEGGAKLMNDIAGKWRHELKTLRRYIAVKEKDQSGGAWPETDLTNPDNRANAVARVAEIVARENSNSSIAQAMEGPLRVMYNQLEMFLQSSAIDKKTIDLTKSIIAEHGAKVTKLNDELAKVKTELDTVQKKLIAAESEHGDIGSNQAKLLDELKSQLLMKDANIKDLQVNSESQFRENEALKAKITKHDEEMKKQQDDCANMDAKLKADLAKLDTELSDQMAKHLEDLTKVNNDKGKNTAAMAEALNKQFKEKTAEYQADIAKLKAEILANNAQNAELQKKLIEQTAELEKLRKTLAENEAKYQADIKTVNDNAQEVIAKLRAEKESSGKASQSSDDIAFIKNAAELERVTLELNERKQEIEVLHNAQSDANKKINEFAAEKQQATREIDQLKKDKQDMNKSFNEIMTNLDKLQKPFTEHPDFKILEESAKKAVLQLIEYAKSFDKYSPEKVIGTMKAYSVWADQTIIRTLGNMAQQAYQHDDAFKGNVKMVDATVDTVKSILSTNNSSKWGELKTILSNDQCPTGIFCYILKLSVIDKILDQIVKPGDKDLPSLLKLIRETEIQ
jgi:DNA repair exonuclease SbcCD ATPase subunit